MGRQLPKGSGASSTDPLMSTWSPARKTASSPGSLSQASSTFVSGQTCINSGAHPIVTFEATERCALGGRERPNLHFTSMVSNSRPYERRPEYQLASLHPMSPGPRSTAATVGVWGRWRRLSWLSLFLLTIPLHRNKCLSLNSWIVQALEKSVYR